jgi:hypothetical protein
MVGGSTDFSTMKVEPKISFSLKVSALDLEGTEIHVFIV